MVLKGNKTLILWSAAIGAFAAICLLAFLAAGSQPADAPPWSSIIPPLLAVTLALVTNRIFLSLGAAVFVGGLLSVPGDSSSPFQPLIHRAGGMFVYNSVTDTGKLQILLYVVLIMSMISVILVAGERRKHRETGRFRSLLWRFLAPKDWPTTYETDI